MAALSGARMERPLTWRRTLRIMTHWPLLSLFCFCSCPWKPQPQEPQRRRQRRGKGCLWSRTTPSSKVSKRQSWTPLQPTHRRPRAGALSSANFTARARRATRHTIRGRWVSAGKRRVLAQYVLTCDGWIYSTLPSAPPPKCLHIQTICSLGEPGRLRKRHR